MTGEETGVDLRRVERRALFAAILTTSMGQSFVFATLPPIGRQLGFSDVETGLIITLAAVMFVVAAPIWGNVADRIGLRRVIAVGLAAAGALTAVFAVAIEMRLLGRLSAPQALGLLIGLRIALAVFAGGLFPAAQAYIAERTTAADRAKGMVLIAAGFGIGSVAGPVFAWLFSEISLTAPFYGMAFLMTAAGGLVAWSLEPARRTGGNQVRSRLALSQLLPFLLVALVAVTAVSSLQQTLGLRLQDLGGLTTAAAIGDAGKGLAVLAAALVAAQIGVGRFGGHPSLLLVAGGVVSAAGFLAVVPASTFLAAVPGLAAIGLGIGLVFPGNIALLSLAAGPDAQARAAGIAAMAQGSGMIAGPILGAAAYGVSAGVPLYGAAGLMTTVLVVGAVAFMGRDRATLR